MNKKRKYRENFFFFSQITLQPKFLSLLMQTLYTYLQSEITLQTISNKHIHIIISDKYTYYKSNIFRNFNIIAWLVDHFLSFLYFKFWVFTFNLKSFYHVVVAPGAIWHTKFWFFLSFILEPKKNHCLAT